MSLLREFYLHFEGSRMHFVLRLLALQCRRDRMTTKPMCPNAPPSPLLMRVYPPGFSHIAPPPLKQLPPFGPPTSHTHKWAIMRAFLVD